MPELPEVEVFKRFIDCHGLHKPIKTVAIQHPKILKHANAAEFEAAMAGGSLESTVRRGKYLFVALQQTKKAKQHLALPWFCLHFGMTGYLGFTGAPGQNQPEWRNAYGDSSKPRNHVGFYRPFYWK